MSRPEDRRRLKCPQAHRDSEGRIRCSAVKDELCAHQRWCGMIGLCVESDGATECTVRTAKQARSDASDSSVKKPPRKPAKTAKTEG